MPAAHALKETSRVINLTRPEREIGSANVFTTRTQLFRPRTPQPKPECPEYLGARGAKMWATIMDTLEDGHLIPTIAAQLEVYIETYLQWHRVRRIIDREGYIQDRVEGRGSSRRRVAQMHPLQPQLMSLATQMMRQYRAMFFTFASRRSEINFVDKLEAVNASVREKSERGGLIGGHLLDEDDSYAS
jgi:P27 family predicted phage terminase small subunit